MNIDQNTLILVLIFSLPLYCIFFICGWLVGKTSSPQNFGGQSIFFKALSAKNNQKISQISIDEKKIVTDISTEGIEKKYSNIANTIQSDQKIGDSVSKLKGLKK